MASMGWGMENRGGPKKTTLRDRNFELARAGLGIRQASSWAGVLASIGIYGLIGGLASIAGLDFIAGLDIIAGLDTFAGLVWAGVFYCAGVFLASISMGLFGCAPPHPSPAQPTTFPTACHPTRPHPPHPKLLLLFCLDDTRKFRVDILLS